MELRASDARMSGQEFIAGPPAPDPHGLVQGVLTHDLLSLVCGEWLGAGLSRVVFQYRPDPDLVIKVETAPGYFQNVNEWHSWNECPDALSGWLAPCVAISESGRWMLQRKTEPLKPSEYPEKVPRWLYDLKPANFGSLDGRPVAHDYGLIAGEFPGAMKAARFRA